MLYDYSPDFSHLKVYFMSHLKNILSFLNWIRTWAGIRGAIYWGYLKVFKNVIQLKKKA